MSINVGAVSWYVFNCFEAKRSKEVFLFLNGFIDWLLDSIPSSLTSDLWNKAFGL